MSLHSQDLALEMINMLSLHIPLLQHIISTQIPGLLFLKITMNPILELALFYFKDFH